MLFVQPQACDSPCIGRWSDLGDCVVSSQQPVGGKNSFYRNRTYSVLVRPYNNGRGCEELGQITQGAIRVQSVKEGGMVHEFQPCVPEVHKTTTTMIPPWVSSTTTTSTTILLFMEGDDIAVMEQTTTSTTTTTELSSIASVNKIIAVSPTFSLDLPEDVGVSQLKDDKLFAKTLCAGFINSVNGLLFDQGDADYRSSDSDRVLTEENCYAVTK